MSTESADYSEQPATTSRPRPRPQRAVIQRTLHLELTTAEDHALSALIKHYGGGSVSAFIRKVLALVQEHGLTPTQRVQIATERWERLQALSSGHGSAAPSDTAPTSTPPEAAPMITQRSRTRGGRTRGHDTDPG